MLFKLRLQSSIQKPGVLENVNIYSGGSRRSLEFKDVAKFTNPVEDIRAPLENAQNIVGANSQSVHPALTHIKDKIDTHPGVRSEFKTVERTPALASGIIQNWGALKGLPASPRVIKRSVVALSVGVTVQTTSVASPMVGLVRCAAWAQVAKAPRVAETMVNLWRRQVEAFPEKWENEVST
jgi:hypothetical protein